MTPGAEPHRPAEPRRPAEARRPTELRHPAEPRHPTEPHCRACAALLLLLTVCSQWTTCDTVARLAVRSHLPSSDRAHFGQYKTTQSLYDVVVARYSSPATAALSRLMLPYLFPDLAAFATVADLITHLRTSDARYHFALPT
ncbi:unnamed protein product [Closterium sp. NIES-53]